jgi:hypothetical protein
VGHFIMPESPIKGFSDAAGTGDALTVEEEL